MAEALDPDAGDGAELQSVFRRISVEQFRRGVVFKADIEQDFELDELYESDGESETEEYAGFGENSNGPRLKDVNLYQPPLVEGLADACENVIPDGGVKKLVLKKGTGIKPPAGGKLFFDYVGFLAENAAQFDASTRRGGEGVMLDESCFLISGLRWALESMEYYEVAQFLIQPEYAYGKMGCPPRIPAEAQVIFNVRIVNYLRAEQLHDPVHMSKEQRNKLEYPAIIDAAKVARDKGNFCFRRNDYSKAVRSYRTAIDILEDFWKVNDQQAQERGELLACIYCNMAQSYVQLTKGPQACNACKNGLKQPGTKYHEKLLFRFAKAKFLVSSYSDALELLKKARAAGAEKSACDQFQEEIMAADKRAKEVEKQMCQLMLRHK